MTRIRNTQLRSLGGVFGVGKDRKTSVWHQSDDNAPEFIAGRPVESVDTFCAGKFSLDKVRPIIVKRHSYWDKRLYFMKDVHFCIFSIDILHVLDEPLDIRRYRR